MRNIAISVVAGLVALTGCGFGDDPSCPVFSHTAEHREADPDLVGLSAQPDGVPFPTEVWPEASPGPDIDAAALDVLLTSALEDPAEPYGKIRGVVVVDDGRIIAEGYGHGHTADHVHTSWSIAKSVTQAMLAIAEGQGLIDLDAPAPVDEWADPGDPRHEITPRDILKMASGLEWNEPEDLRDFINSYETTRASTIQASRELVAEPGTTYNYSTGSTAINASLINHAVGTGDDFNDWARACLFDPLGMGGVALGLDVEGNFLGGVSADMTVRDYARFGLLYARDGVWDGKRILPEGTVDDARTPSQLVDADGNPVTDYGQGWRMSRPTPGSFAARGLLGQNIIVIPEHDIVTVVVASNGEGELNAGFETALLDLVVGG